MREGRATGSALGMTGSGEVDFSGKSVDFDGVLIPAYTANSILGNIPVLGELVGKDGEGIFGLNYSVIGPFSKTTVAVNPLSALTPGFLRRIFDVEREDMAIPERAEESEITPDE